MDTDYTSDSDVSDDTRELVNQGLASARCKREKVTARSDPSAQRRLVPNTDISSVRHQMLTENSIDAALTRDLKQSGRIIDTSQNHNSDWYVVLSELNTNSGVIRVRAY